MPLNRDGRVTISLPASAYGRRQNAINWIIFLMSMFDSIRRQITPIHPEGYIFIGAFAVVALALSWAWSPLGWMGFALTLWCAYFFRDPARLTPLDAHLIVSPADGIVSAVGFFKPPPELGLGAEAMPRISIFMSVFDCHVN